MRVSGHLSARPKRDAYNIIKNGGFESPAITPGSAQCENAGDSIGPWTVVSNSGHTNCIVYILSTSYVESGGSLKFQAKAGGQSVDLSGSFNQGANGVSQLVRGLTTNTSYTISFFVGTQDNRYSGYNGPGVVDVLINGNYPFNVTPATASVLATGRRLL